MKTEGWIKGISGYRNPTVMLQLEANPEDLEKLGDKKLSVELQIYREGRSISANNYFHALVDKIADKRGISKTRCKNEMITSYGQKDYLNDGTVIAIKSNLPPEVMAEQESLHCRMMKPDPDYPNVFYYIVYRGTHTYNTAEMAHLIDCVIAEAEEQGIETITENQKLEMMERYGRKYSEHGEG